MDKKVRMIIGILFLLLITSVLGGCKSTQYIPVKETCIDTVYKARKDSIRWINHTNIKDSTRWRDSSAVTLDDKGNIKRTDTWHWREHTTNKSESTSYYKRLSDSLKEARLDSIPKPYPVTKYVEKKLSWWQNLVMKIGYVGLFSMAILAVYYGINLWRKFNITSIINKIIKH